MKALIILIALCVTFSIAIADAVSAIQYSQPEVIYVNQHGEQLPSPQESNRLEAFEEPVVPAKS